MCIAGSPVPGARARVSPALPEAQSGPERARLQRPGVPALSFSAPGLCAAHVASRPQSPTTGPRRGLPLASFGRTPQLRSAPGSFSAAAASPPLPRGERAPERIGGQAEERSGWGGVGGRDLDGGPEPEGERRLSGREPPGKVGAHRCWSAPGTTLLSWARVPFEVQSAELGVELKSGHCRTWGPLPNSYTRLLRAGSHTFPRSATSPWVIGSTQPEQRATQGRGASCSPPSPCLPPLPCPSPPPISKCSCHTPRRSSY